MEAIPKRKDDRKLVTMIFVFLALTFGGLAYLAAKMQSADETPPPPQAARPVAADQELSPVGEAPIPSDSVSYPDAEPATSVVDPADVDAATDDGTIPATSVEPDDTPGVS